ERVTSAKPLTLRGAGWDKTIIKPDKGVSLTQQEKDDFFRKLEGTSDREQRTKLALEIAGVSEHPTLAVQSAKDVKIENLKVQGRDQGSGGEAITPDTLVMFDHASGAMSGCAVVGPYMNGIDVA